MNPKSSASVTFDEVMARSALGALVECYEARKPRVVKGGSILRLDEVYQSFSKRVAAFNAGHGENPGKFFVDGSQVQTDVAQCYPSSEHATAESYIQGLNHSYAGREVLCYGYDFRDVSPEIASRLDEFMREFNSRVSYRPKEVYTELFIGKYKMTAGGIHKEEASNFQMVLHGSKTMVVWPEDTWRVESEVTDDMSDKMSGRVELYLKDKQLYEADSQRVELVGEPGDLIYWPERWWHVGHCHNYTVSVTVPLYY